MVSSPPYACPPVLLGSAGLKTPARLCAQWVSIRLYDVVRLVGLRTLRWLGNDLRSDALKCCVVGGVSRCPFLAISDRVAPSHPRSLDTIRVSILKQEAARSAPGARRPPLRTRTCFSSSRCVVADSK
jgi:hypothetical protein